MYRYQCHVCGGLCDAGELENEVCYECRQKAVRNQEERSLQIRKEINKKIHCYAMQSDGQMVMNYGTY